MNPAPEPSDSVTRTTPKRAITEAYQTMFGIFWPLSLAQNGTINTENSAMTAPLEALVMPSPRTWAVYPMNR